MKRNVLAIELTWKGALGVVGVLALGVGLYFGGNLVYHKIQSRPRSVAALKRDIFGFLKEKSGKRDFEIDLKAAVAAEMATVDKELRALQEEIPLLQTNIANLQSQIRTNREELTASNQELRRLKRQAGILPQRNRPLATTTNNVMAAGATNVVGLSNAVAVAAENAASTNLTFDLAAASLTNESFKVIFEKDKALTAKQGQMASLQKELNGLTFKLNGRQRAIAAKEKELKNLQAGTGVESKLARQSQQQMQEAMSWESVYQALGQELWLADHMLGSTNLDMRQGGLQLADQARAQAINTAENGWLACRVIEAYIWPNLDLAEGQAGNGANRDQLLASAGITFQNSGEMNNFIKNAEMLIAKSRNPVKADYARFRLAQTFEGMGNYEAALKQLRAIQSSNSLVYAARRIPVVEDKLKSQRRK